MALVSLGTMGDLVQGMSGLVAKERGRIIAWLRAHEGQHERAIAAGACIRGSTMHGELRDQAAHYAEVAEALEKMADSAWEFGFVRNEWLLPPTPDRSGEAGETPKSGSTEGESGLPRSGR